MKTHHFTTPPEGTRDLSLALVWLAAALIAGVAVNLGYIVLGVWS